MSGPPEALLKKGAAASDRANRARLRLRQARKLKIRQLNIREVDARELYLGKLNFRQINFRQINFRQINLRELHFRQFHLGQLYLRKFNFRRTDSCRFFGLGGFGGFFLRGVLFNLRAFLNRFSGAGRVLRALNRQ